MRLEELELREQLEDRIRRHEADARDLEKVRKALSEESARAFAAEMVVEELADALESIRATECWTNTYCEFCQAHAPQDNGGVPCGPIPHFEECARAEAEDALRKAGRLPERNEP